MLNVKIICIGKLKEKYLQMAQVEFEKRLNGYCKIEVIELNEVKCSENPSKKEIENVIEKEGLSILKKLNSNNPYVITLCIEGSIISSEIFAKELEKSHTISGGTIYFIIGGSFGLCENVKKISSLKLSFSKMTFTHQMARIILMEQIYRGFQINSNGKYHK